MQKLHETRNKVDLRQKFILMREIKETDDQLLIPMFLKASQSTLAVCCVLHLPDFPCRLGVAYFDYLNNEIWGFFSPSIYTHLQDRITSPIFSTYRKGRKRERPRPRSSKVPNFQKKIFGTCLFLQICGPGVSSQLIKRSGLVGGI